MKRYLEYSVILLISLLFAVFFGRNYIWSDGFVYLAEQFEVYTVEDFWGVFYPTWNEKLGTVNFADLPKLYLYAPLTAISGMLGSYKLLQAILLLLPYPVAFLSMFILAKHFICHTIEEADREEIVSISSALAAFVFTINPWFAMTPRNILLRISYAFLPLLIYLFLRMLEEKNMKFILLFAMGAVLVATYRYSLLLSIVLIIVFLLYSSLSELDLKGHMYQSQKVLIACIIFGFLSAGKFLPMLFYTYFAPIQAVEQFTIAKVRRDPLLHIFTTRISEAPGCRFDATYNDMTHFLVLLVTIYALTYVLYKRPKKRREYFYLITPPIVIILFAPLCAEELNLIGLLADFPFLDFLGRLLRHARWNIMPIIVSISIMTGLSTTSLLSKLKSRLAYLLLVPILILASISAWPTFTGDMNGYWSPAEVPEDYIVINDSPLAVEQDVAHALWMPIFSTNKAVWVNASAPFEIGAPTGIFALRSSKLSTFDYSRFYFFDYYNPTGWRLYHRPLDGYEGMNWGDIFRQLNVRYLIIHRDVDWGEDEKRLGLTNEHLETVVDSLKVDETLKVLYEGEYLTAFEIPNANPVVTTSAVALVHGGLPVHATLALQTENISIIYFDGEMLTSEIIGHASHILLRTSEDALEEMLIALADEKILLEPSRFVEKIVSPQTTWSYYPSTSDYNFQNNLKRMGISKWAWNLDYQKGLISTWASNTTLEIPFEITEASDYRFFIRYLENQNGGLVNICLNDNVTQIDTLDSLNRFVWKDLETYHLDKGKNELILQNVEGFNAINLLALLPEEEYYEAEAQAEQTLKNKTVIHLLEAESDLYYENAHSTDIFAATASQGEVLTLEGNKSVILFDGEEDYVKVPHNSTLNINDQITVSLWVKPHDSQSDQILVAKDDWASIGRAVLPVRIHNKRYGMRIVDPRSKGNDNYDWSFFSPPNIVEEENWQHIVFVIDTTAEPSVARFYLNGNLVNEETDEEAGKTVSSLQTNTLPLHIGAGFRRRYFDGQISEVVIYNHALDNAEIERLYNEVDPRQIAPDNLILYFNLAMQDVEADTIETLNDLSGNGNHGTVYGAEALFNVQGGVAWQDLEIGEDGQYKLAVSGQGELKIAIGGNTTTLLMDELNITYLNPVYLEKGTNRLELTSIGERSYLDVVWLYPAKRENQTLQDILSFEQTPAEILDCRKIDATKYIVEANVTQPFMLSFAEAYDPLWIATVNDTEIESVPLFSLINGFWINQTGQLKISIEYTPQKWFYYGLTISTTTFIACIAYIAYDWGEKRKIPPVKETGKRAT